MKKFSSLLILTLLFCVSCKDSEPTAPQETSQNQPLAEKTIGPDGGIIEAEDFKLEISAGTFTESITLKLYPDPEENPYSANSLTKRYLVEGLSADYKNPLKVGE